MNQAIYVLPLDDPKWAGLEVFRRGPKDLPTLIRELQLAPADPSHPALDHFTAAIYHQYSTVVASYVCFPYLLDLCERSNHRNHRVFFLAANIAASATRLRPELPQDITDAWLAAARRFEEIATAWAAAAAPLPWDAFDRSVAALAFNGHRCSRLWMDGIEPETDPDSNNRTSVECPQCSDIVTLALFEEGAVPTDRNDNAEPPSPPHPWPRPPQRDMAAPRTPNPWSALEPLLSQAALAPGVPAFAASCVDASRQLCATGIDPATGADEVFCLIGSVLWAHGHQRNGQRFWRMLDTVTCPACRASFVAANRWWGMFG